jgi:hypothetical protein
VSDAIRKGVEYRRGELETILSLVPTDANISHLAALLDRSEDAIRIVYRMAYTSFGRLRGKGGDIQREKIRTVCRRLHINISGRG